MHGAPQIKGRPKTAFRADYSVPLSLWVCMVKTIGVCKGNRKRTGRIHRDVPVAGVGDRHSGATGVVERHDAVTGVGDGNNLSIVENFDRSGTVFSNRNIAAIVLDVNEAAGGCGCGHSGRLGTGHRNRGCCRYDWWYYNNWWHDNDWCNYRHNRYSGRPGDVDVCVNQCNRSVQDQCSAVQCYYVDVAGGG